jgi:UDP-N-acetyl-D-glucosamine dehydrogenase
MREHHFTLASVRLVPDTVASYDLVLIATNHSAFDYDLIEKYAKVIVDTRGVYLERRPHVVKS